MRSMHQSGALQPLGATPRQLHLAGPLRLQAERAGWLQVDGGTVWLTRDGGGDDEVLDAGVGLALGRGERVLVEPWRVGQAAQLRWARVAPAARAQPPLPRPLAALVYALAARALRGAAGRLALAARSAEARASRAQGCMPAGDSMASSGALQ